MFFLIAGSIIGPAMAGPTGPFATALHRQHVKMNAIVLTGIVNRNTHKI